MPELPEVETVRRGLRPLEGATLASVQVRDHRLRYPVDEPALRRLVGRRVGELGRRAKYLLMPTAEGGGMIIHLGMSGRLFMVDPGAPLDRHDHVLWRYRTATEEIELRYQDPRRFGMVLVDESGDLSEHRLLTSLGPEPLGDEFTGRYAFDKTRGSRRPVKTAIMDGRFVVGVGNIYASEALWHASVHPQRAAGKIAGKRWDTLCGAIRGVLQTAIDAGGTTLKDFRGADGTPGYFQRSLSVYGRAGEACDRCGGSIRKFVQAGRATYYCPSCQH